MNVPLNKISLGKFPNSLVRTQNLIESLTENHPEKNNNVNGEQTLNRGLSIEYLVNPPMMKTQETIYSHLIWDAKQNRQRARHWRKQFFKLKNGQIKH